MKRFTLFIAGLAFGLVIAFMFWQVSSLRNDMQGLQNDINQAQTKLDKLQSLDTSINSQVGTPPTVLPSTNPNYVCMYIGAQTTLCKPQGN